MSNGDDSDSEDAVDKLRQMKSARLACSA